MSGKMLVDDLLRQDWKRSARKTNRRVQELADLHNMSVSYAREVLFGPGIESVPGAKKEKTMYTMVYGGDGRKKKPPEAGLTIKQWREKLDIKPGDLATVAIDYLDTDTKIHVSGTVLAIYPWYCLLQAENYKICAHWTDIERVERNETR